MTIQVILGNLTLEGLEIPERMPFAIQQSLAVQKLIGGARVIDAMGRDDQPITWTGWFTGTSALQRAEYLHTACVQGQSLTLTWSTLNYQVVIDSFEPNYEYEHRIPYTISCTVLQDNTNPVTSAPDNGIDDQMGSDLNEALSLAALIGDSNLTTLVGVVGTALSAVTTLTNASNSTLTSVLSPITAAQTYIGNSISTADGSLNNSAESAAGFGGVVTGIPVATMIANLSTQASLSSAEPSMLSLSGVLGRMAANVNSIRTNATTVTTAGGSLYDIASQEYGDPTSWTAIAKANGLSDPELVNNIDTLTIPGAPDTAGGVLVG